MKINRWLQISVFIVVGSLVLSSTRVFAQTSSTDYKIDEYFFGAGGENDLTSPDYQGRASLGDTGVGNFSSTNYQIYGGFTTTNSPHLELMVTAATIDFGVLDPAATKTGTASFSVRSYLSGGYSVTTYSPGPQNGEGHTLSPMTTAGSSSVGVEQFGMNLVANTLPVAFGAAPAQVPSTDFSYGYAATGYDTTNTYKYTDGDVIARSDSASGQTDYTIAYIMNVDENTPSGLYTMRHFVIATPTF